MGLSPAGWVGGVARGRRRWLVHRSVHDLVFLVRPVGGWFPLGVGNGGRVVAGGVRHPVGS